MKNNNKEKVKVNIAGEGTPVEMAGCLRDEANLVGNLQRIPTEMALDELYRRVDRLEEIASGLNGRLLSSEESIRVKALEGKLDTLSAGTAAKPPDHGALRCGTGQKAPEAPSQPEDIWAYNMRCPAPKRITAEQLEKLGVCQACCEGEQHDSPGIEIVADRLNKFFGASQV